MSHLKVISEHEFSSTIQSGVVLVDFYADWCGPCRALVPHLQQVSAEVEGKASLVQINVDHAQRVSEQYQITSIPALILFKEGKEVGRIVGLRDAKAIKDFILSVVS
ncbi:MAG: thioredoxin [Candidatus Rhabdochlamydia sp.]